MGYQRGQQAPKPAPTSDRQSEPSTQAQNRPEHPVDILQAMFGSRAASRQIRAGNGVANLVGRSRFPVSPRAQGKPLFRGISQEWGTAPATGLVVQPKLTIGAPNDQYEQEADRVAEQVVQRLNVPAVGRSSANQTLQRETLPDDKDELQMKPLLQRDAMPGEAAELQMKSTSQGGGAIAASDNLESAIQQSRGCGQPLADSIRLPMEYAFGRADFSGVKVHTDAQSDQLNRAIHSRAFTTKQDIYFRHGEYKPHTTDGNQLLAHELTHVVQQQCPTVQSTTSTASGALRGYQPRHAANIQGLFIQAQDMDENELASFMQLLGEWKRDGVIDQQEYDNTVTTSTVNNKTTYSLTTDPNAKPQQGDDQKLLQIKDKLQVFSNTRSKQELETFKTQLTSGLSDFGKGIANLLGKKQTANLKATASDIADFTSLVNNLATKQLIDQQMVSAIQNSIASNQEENIVKTDLPSFKKFLEHYSYSGRALWKEKKEGFKASEKNYPGVAMGFYNQLSYIAQKYADAFIMQYAKTKKEDLVDIRGAWLVEKQKNDSSGNPMTTNGNPVMEVIVDSTNTPQGIPIEQFRQALDEQKQLIERQSQPEVRFHVTWRQNPEWELSSILQLNTGSAGVIHQTDMAVRKGDTGGAKIAIGEYYETPKEKQSHKFLKKGKDWLKDLFSPGAGAGEGISSAAHEGLEKGEKMIDGAYCTATGGGLKAPMAIHGLVSGVTEIIALHKKYEELKQHYDLLGRQSSATDEQKRTAKSEMDQVKAALILKYSEVVGKLSDTAAGLTELGEGIKDVVQSGGIATLDAVQHAVTVLSTIGSAIGIITGGVSMGLASNSARLTKKHIEELKETIEQIENSPDYLKTLEDLNAKKLAEKTQAKKEAKQGKKIASAVGGSFTIGASTAGIAAGFLVGSAALTATGVGLGLGVVGAGIGLGLLAYAGGKRINKDILHKKKAKEMVRKLRSTSSNNDKLEAEAYFRDVLHVPPAYIESQFYLAEHEAMKQRVKTITPQELDSAKQKLKEDKPLMSNKEINKLVWHEDDVNPLIEKGVIQSVKVLIDSRRLFTASYLYDAIDSWNNIEKTHAEELLTDLGCLDAIKGYKLNSKRNKAVKVIAEKLASS